MHDERHGVPVDPLCVPIHLPINEDITQLALGFLFSLLTGMRVQREGGDRHAVHFLLLDAWMPAPSGSDSILVRLTHSDAKTPTTLQARDCFMIKRAEGMMQFFRGSETLLIDDKDSFQVDPLGLNAEKARNLCGLTSLFGGFRVLPQSRPIVENTPPPRGVHETKIWELFPQESLSR